MRGGATASMSAVSVCCSHLPFVRVAVRGSVSGCRRPGGARWVARVWCLLLRLYGCDASLGGTRPRGSGSIAVVIGGDWGGHGRRASASHRISSMSSNNAATSGSRRHNCSAPVIAPIPDWQFMRVIVLTPTLVELAPVRRRLPVGRCGVRSRFCGAWPALRPEFVSAGRRRCNRPEFGRCRVARRGTVGG